MQEGHKAADVRAPLRENHGTHVWISLHSSHCDCDSDATNRARAFKLCTAVPVQEGREPADIRTELREECGIHVWISPLSSTRIDMEDKGLDMVVRCDRPNPASGLCFGQLRAHL